MTRSSPIHTTDRAPSAAARPARAFAPGGPKRRRSAAVTLELILALPILFIALLVVVEFGLILANLKQVALASREGARLAADAPALNAALAAAARSEVDQRLETAGFGANASAGLTLRHSVAAQGGPASFTDGVCADPTMPALPAEAVRVTVCVPLSKLTPDFLSAYGFSIAGLTVEHTTTVDYEN